MKEEEQVKRNAERERGRVKNDLCAASTSRKTNPEHRQDRACRMNYEGTRVLTLENNSAIDPKKCRELLLIFVMSSGASFNLLKNNRFIEWARDLQPMYDLSNVISIEPDCFRLQNIFNNNVAKISLSAMSFEIFGRTLDYVCFTMHYIDNNFNLVRELIHINEINGPTKFTVVEHLARTLQKWGLEKNLLAVTIGSFEVDPQLNGGVWETSLRCNICGFLDKLCTWFRYFLEDEVDGIAKIYEFLVRNPDVVQTFNQVALTHNLPPKSDFQVDWEEDLEISLAFRSTMQKLHDALPYRDVFIAIVPPREKSLSRDECDEEESEEEDGLSLDEWDEEESEEVDGLSRDGWNYVEYCVKLWEPICKAANILSSFKYPTSNLLLRIVFEIRDVLLCSRVPENPTRELSEKLLQYVDYFWKGCNTILFIASIFDPQFKFFFLERCHKENIINEQKVQIYFAELCGTYEIEVTEKGLGMIELNRYREEGLVEIEGDADFDILRWWKDNQTNYPIMSRIARDILAIPVSSLPWELFSHPPKWYKHPRMVKSENLLGECVKQNLEHSDDPLSAPSTNSK